MARVRYEGKYVDVARRDCLKRDCFAFGFDKGTFVQGRGYVDYHEKPRPVCMTRHIHGCPHHSVCPECRLLELDGPGATCQVCGGTTVAREEDQ